MEPVDIEKPLKKSFKQPLKQPEKELLTGTEGLHQD